METFELTFKNEKDGKSKSVVLPVATDLVGSYTGYRYKIYQYRVRGASSDVILSLKGGEHRFRLAVNSPDTIAVLKKEIPLSFSYLTFEVLNSDNTMASSDVEVTLYFERVQNSPCVIS
nr:hypothetical protein K-LCC10_0388 [Kaumoebavirus]